MNRAAALKRERPAAYRIPYTTHISPQVIRTADGCYLQVLKVDGASFESADDEVLNNWHERLNILYRNIASPQVALWTHMVRHRERMVPAGGKGGLFAEALAAKYRDRLASETLMVNDLYLTVVYRPVSGTASTWASRLLRKTSKDNHAVELADALDGCEKLRQALLSSLARYEPECLGVYTAGRLCSHVLEFLAHLINAERQPIPLPRAPLNEVLATSRVIFGTETVEYRLPAHTRFGAILGIKEYQTTTPVGLYDELLSAPFPFVLTQSFTFLSKAAGQGLLQRQYNQMVNAGDFAVTQAEELKEALDDLTGNAFVIGDHHFTLQVLTEPDVPETGAIERQLQQLNDHVALARSLLADTGMTVAREDLALEAAYWAQLPGCFRYRPRKAPITSRNFAAKAAFHNFPTGRSSNNHWGDALTLLITSARSPYYFSLHASDPKDPDGGSRKDTGHTFICGPTGSGKTTWTKALIREIPGDERLITIEDAKELVLDQHPNHVRLFYSKDGQGLARVTPKQLLEACLRLYPSRILLAELRAEEAFDYLRNVNSGHPGSITSVHAASAELAFEQLVLLVKQSRGGQELTRSYIKSLLYQLVDVVIQFGVEHHERYIKEIWYVPDAKYGRMASA